MIPTEAKMFEALVLAWGCITPSPKRSSLEFGIIGRMAGVNAAQLKKQYGSLLRNRGIKATYKRMLILWLLDNPTDKPLMPELCERLRQYIPYQRHSAVYRAVKELSGAGLLRTVVVSTKVHLDGWQQADHNLVCRSCGVVDSISTAL